MSIYGNAIIAGGPKPEALSVTANGTYTRDKGGYSPVTVNVPEALKANTLKNGVIADGTSDNMYSVGYVIDIDTSGSTDRAKMSTLSTRMSTYKIKTPYGTGSIHFTNVSLEGYSKIITTSSQSSYTQTIVFVRNYISGGKVRSTYKTLSVTSGTTETTTSLPMTPSSGDSYDIIFLGGSYGYTIYMTARFE